MPDRCGLDRRVVHPGVEGDFGGAPRDARIARALREIDVRLRGERGVAALACDLREQKLVEQVLGQLLIGKRRAVHLLGCERLRFPGGRVRVGFVLRFLSRSDLLRRSCGASRKHDERHRGKQPQSGGSYVQLAVWTKHGGTCCLEGLV